MKNQPKSAVIQSRIKPAVYKKNTTVSVPKTIKVVVQPSIAKTVELEEAQRLAKQTKIAASNKKQPNKPLQQAISNNINPGKRTLKRTNKPVQYITREAPPESIAKIKGIQNKGKNRILAIIGNGPSLGEIPIEQLKNIENLDTLSINKPDPRIWPTTHWAFFDRSQYRRHQEIWNSYDGFIFNSTSIKEQKPKSMQFTNRQGLGFSRDLTSHIYIGYSSVYASLQIALWMNYEAIYIFGCDMNPDGLNGRLHFYGTNPDVDPKQRAQRFERESKSYDYAANNLPESDRKKITFCTDYNPWSFVKSFKQISHKKALEFIKDHARSTTTC